MWRQPELTLAAPCASQPSLPSPPLLHPPSLPWSPPLAPCRAPVCRQPALRDLGAGVCAPRRRRQAASRGGGRQQQQRAAAGCGSQSRGGPAGRRWAALLLLGGMQRSRGGGGGGGPVLRCAAATAAMRSSRCLNKRPTNTVWCGWPSWTCSAAGPSPNQPKDLACMAPHNPTSIGRRWPSWARPN